MLQFSQKSWQTMDFLSGSGRAQIALSSAGPSVVSTDAGYPSAIKEMGQPFCGNVEGWGPLSKTRYDFTPCFLDVWISSVAVYGILLGSAAIWWLLKRTVAQPVPKNWHFYAKLASDGL